jgi:hypothetical protein
MAKVNLSHRDRRCGCGVAKRISRRLPLSAEPLTCGRRRGHRACGMVCAVVSRSWSRGAGEMEQEMMIVVGGVSYRRVPRACGVVLNDLRLLVKESETGEMCWVEKLLLGRQECLA